MGALADAARRRQDETSMVAGSEEQAPVVVPESSSALASAARGGLPEGTQIIMRDLPDGGRIYRFPNGTLNYVDAYMSTSDPAKIKEIIDKAPQIRGGEVSTPSEQAVSQIRREAIDQFGMPGAVSQQFLEGMPFVGSYFDEMLAGGDPRKLHTARQISEAMKQEYPKTSTAANIAGLAAGTVGGALMAPEMAIGTTLPTAGRAAIGALTTGGLGATEGAIYGYGKGTDEASRQAEAIGGARTGLLVGAPIGAAIPYLGRIWTAFKNRGGRGSIAPEIAAEFGVSTEAARMIENALESGGSFDQMIDRIRRAGDQGMIADADEATAILLDQAAASSPRVAAEVRRPVTERATESSRQLSGDMDVALGAKPEGMQTSYEAIAARSKGARGEAYREAFDSPINYASPEGMRLEEIFNRIPDQWKAEAIAIANRSMQAQGKRNQQIMADIADDGTVTFREMPNVQQLHEIKVALNQFARKGDNVDAFGNIKGEGITIANLAQELRNALGDAVPKYRDASKIGGDKIREQEALILGGKVLNSGTTRDDVVRVLKDASADERAAAKLGLRNSIDEAMANAKSAATTGRDEAVAESMKILRDLSSRANKTKVEIILGKPQADALFKRLDETRAALELQAATARGSQTAIRTAGREMAEDVLEPGVLRSAAELDPVGTVKKLREFLAGTGPAYRQGRSEQMWSEVAGVLTGKRGMDAQTALRYIEQAKQGKNLSKPQESYVANTIMKYLGAGATMGAANQ